LVQVFTVVFERLMEDADKDKGTIPAARGDLRNFLENEDIRTGVATRMFENLAQFIYDYDQAPVAAGSDSGVAKSFEGSEDALLTR
jgi:hypothetical protein